MQQVIKSLMVSGLFRKRNKDVTPVFLGERAAFVEVL